MDSQTAVFDSSRPITINLRAPGGVKTVRLRYPTDDEWVERQRQRKVIIKQLGRGMSETIMPGGEDIDAALLESIRDGDTAIDPFEAVKIVEQLSAAEVDSVEPDGDSYRVTMRVLGGLVVHVLKAPSAKDAFDYRRGFARVLDMPYGRQQLTVNILPAGELYKRLVSNTEGYEGPVPIVHQVVAVKAVIDAVDSAFTEDHGANF